VRATRLISLLLLLQAREGMTAAELARELRVSERTVYRDVQALSAAGVPVYAEHGPGGGYRLVDGYRTRLTGLTREEAEALFLSGLPGPADQMGLADLVTAARLKVTAALPAAFQDAPTRVSQRFHLDIPGWFTDVDPPPALSALARAVWQDLIVRMRYRARQREVTRTVQPYGLVLKAGTWYLVGRVDDDYRTYRVDRVLSVEPTGEVFNRDVSFPLATFWAEHGARFVASLLTDRVTIRLSPTGLRALRYAMEPPAARQAYAAAGEPDAHGWVTTELPVESIDVAYTQLLALGPEVEVLEPPRLRARLAEAAQRLIDLYRTPITGDPKRE